MAEQNYPVPDAPEYNEAIRRIKNTDPVSATDVVNPVISQMIENTHAVKLDADSKVPADCKRTSRFVVGTSTAGWEKKDVDYLCDGTDDQEEILAALNALPEWGGEVLILSGTYHITGNIEISKKSNVTLRGSGESTVLKRMWDTGITGVVYFLHTPYARVADLKIDGSADVYDTDNLYNLVFDSDSDFSTVEHVTSINCTDNGINLYSSNYVTVRGCYCSNNWGDGIHIEYGGYARVIGNTCKNNYGHGITSGRDHGVIYGNICEGNSSNGIIGCQKCAITGNRCQGNVTGIVPRTSNAVAGNECVDNEIGIRAAKNCAIVGNRVLRGTGTAADYTDAQHTIQIRSSDSLVAANLTPGKPCTDEGTNTTLANNKA